MSKPLRLLLVEDSKDDAERVIRELRRGGFQSTYKRVETQAEFKSALEAQAWDVIVSDHSLPTYGGLTALADLRATEKDIPFILVSGTVGETVAVSAMRAGAHDYVLKGDLTRLPAAVERELREAALRAEQAKLREQLAISQRMASAGVLAAGLAHEINNPLAVAMANLDFTADTVAHILADASDIGRRGDSAAVWDRLRRIAELEEPFRDAQEALRRIRDIVRDVKVFSRPHDDAMCGVDVRHALDTASRMAQNEIRHRARLVKDYRVVPMVNANESRLGQVLLNLIVNAAQAMPEGHAEGNEIRLVTRTREGGRVVIEVSDTGPGIPKENLERIFDPFFTTKPTGIGTGLGLAICHRIVSELGGLIEVESNVGKGTLFRLVLPAATEGAARAKPISTPPPPRHRARVLVVDDEVAVGRVLQRGLSGHHDVVALTSGREALARIAAGERFDVILSDLMMPDVTGMEIHEEIQRIDPDQARRMVFLTGGAFTSSAREFLERVPNPTIEKPFDPRNVLAIIAGLAPPVRSDDR